MDSNIFRILGRMHAGNATERNHLTSTVLFASSPPFARYARCHSSVRRNRSVIVVHPRPAKITRDSRRDHASRNLTVLECQCVVAYITIDDKEFAASNLTSDYIALMLSAGSLTRNKNLFERVDKREREVGPWAEPFDNLEGGRLEYAGVSKSRAKDARGAHGRSE